jgi:hypothetical protein
LLALVERGQTIGLRNTSIQAGSTTFIGYIEELDLAEQYMNDSGLYTADQIRNVNELRMRARWKLGRLLANFARAAGPGRGKKMGQGDPSFSSALASLELDNNTAKRAQRIGALPAPEFDKALAAR